MLSDEQKKALDEPLDPERIKGRDGPGNSKLSYLSQDDIKRTANRIFGFAEWDYEPVEIVCLGSEPVQRSVERTIQGEKRRVTEDGTRVAYRATVRVRIFATEATYVDTGYGEDVSYTSTLQPHELATKEAVSDAVKRALVPLGDQFGLSLYEKAGAAGGRRAKQAPPTLTVDDLKAIHATRNDFDVAEDDLKRIARFVADMPSLTSMKQVPRAHRKALIEGLKFFASDPATAEQQLADFESNSGITREIVEHDPVDVEHARAEAAAEAAGVPDGYG